jgi:hypothetical protein
MQEGSAVSDDAALAVSDGRSEPAAKTSLRSLAVRGALWTLAGDGGTQLIRFISNLILTRLLAQVAGRREFRENRRHGDRVAGSLL